MDTNVIDVKKIISYNPPFPKCKYSVSSKRNVDPDKKISVTQKIISQLEGWNLYDEIIVDGQNATTKSTFTKNLQRRYIKINDLMKHVTSGSSYNYDPIRSMEYLIFQLSTKSPNSVWDRSPYSNLIFYYVHYLMSVFKDEAIPMDINIVWPILNKLAMDTNLLDTISVCKEINNKPTIFFVCSDLEFITTSMLKRGLSEGNVNDVWNSKEYNYQVAQYHCYVWFGKLMNYPVIDLVDFLEEGYTINGLHTVLAAKIDRPCSSSLEKIEAPDQTDSHLLQSLISHMQNDILIYDFSRK